MRRNAVRILPLQCPDVAVMLSGYYRNGCPDVAEIRTEFPGELEPSTIRSLRAEKLLCDLGAATETPSQYPLD